MPIKGLTDRDRRLPRIGKIHLGIKDEKKGYPKATDYFVFPEGHANYDDLVRLFGEKPNELRIVFPVESEDKIASQYYRCYSRSRGLICKGDGETCRRLVDTQTGALADADSKAVGWKEMACAGRECPDYGSKCKEVMNLQFMLPEVPGLGIWQIDSGSFNSIININAGLDMIRAVYGRVAMVPLILSLEPQEVTPEGGKKKTVRCLHIRSGDTLQLAAQRAMIAPMKLIASLGVPLLPEPDDEMPDVVPDWDQDEPTERMTPEEIKQAIDDYFPSAPKVGKVIDQEPATEKKPQTTTAPPVVVDGDSEVIEQEEDTGYDLKWYETSIKSLGWADVGKYLAAKYKVSGTRVSEKITNLNKLQEAEFHLEVESRLELL